MSNCLVCGRRYKGKRPFCMKHEFTMSDAEKHWAMDHYDKRCPECDGKGKVGILLTKCLSCGGTGFDASKI